MPTWAQSRPNAFDTCIWAIRRDQPFGSTFRAHIDITNYSHLSRSPFSGLQDIGTLGAIRHMPSGSKVHSAVWIRA